MLVNEVPTNMSQKEALELADELNKQELENDTGWYYQVEYIGNYSRVKVYDDLNEFLGYL